MLIKVIAAGQREHHELQPVGVACHVQTRGNREGALEPLMKRCPVGLRHQLRHRLEQLRKDAVGFRGIQERRELRCIEFEMVAGIGHIVLPSSCKPVADHGTAAIEPLPLRDGLRHAPCLWLGQRGEQRRKNAYIAHAAVQLQAIVPRLGKVAEAGLQIRSGVAGGDPAECGRRRVDRGEAPQALGAHLVVQWQLQQLRSPCAIGLQRSVGQRIDVRPPVAAQHRGQARRVEQGRIDQQPEADG
ncbi:hypothetical protein D3C86_1465280 [compost metagenome]